MTHNREKEWGTADGRRIKVKDMTDGHVVNVVNWILDNPRSYPASALTLFVSEAMYRQTVLFAEGKAYPQLVGSRWKLIDPQTGVGKIESRLRTILRLLKTMRDINVWLRKLEQNV